MYKQEDLETCYEMIKKGSHSFYAASKILPKKVRNSAIVLYSFCRIVDDAIDDSQTKVLSLKKLFVRLEKVYLGKPENHASDRCFARRSTGRLDAPCQDQFWMGTVTAGIGASESYQAGEPTLGDDSGPFGCKLASATDSGFH